VKDYELNTIFIETRADRPKNVTKSNE